jgi:hypothetical protein
LKVPFKLSLHTRSAHQSVCRLPGQFDAPGFPGRSQYTPI